MTQISLFAGPIDSPSPQLLGKYPIESLIGAIIAGTWKPIVEQARAIADKKERQYFKIKSVPFFYPSAHLTDAKREDGDAAQHSGLIAIDIDGTDPVRAKQLIGNDPYLHAAFVSVSGNGVCALFAVEPPGMYGQDAARSLGKFNVQAWTAIADYLRDRYQLVADKSGKNIARARYVSVDDAVVGNGANALPFPVKLEADDVTMIASKYGNVARPDLIVDLLSAYLKAEIDRSYFTRDNLQRAGYDVSGYAHNSVIRIAWYCGGFDHLIGGVGRQLLAEQFLSTMEGRPNFDRSTDARKWLDQYDRGTARPLAVDDLPGGARIAWKQPTATGTIDPEDERLFRVECRAAIYNGKMSEHWVAQFAALAAMSLETATTVANEEIEKYAKPINALRRNVQAMQFVKMANLSGIKFAEGIGQPVHIDTDQHRAINKDAIRSIIEQETGVRFGRDATTEGFARIHEGERFDPIRAWLRSMPKYDGVDRIGQLAAYFKTSDDKRFARYLRLWLTATAKCAIDESFTNRFAMVMTSGRQSIGKSYFFASYLVDPHLYSEGIELNGRDGDIGRALAAALIVNLEEFTAPKDVARLKKIISQPSFSARAAFGRAPELFIRRASFAVCTNDPMFLTDVSNTRFLCSVIDSIDHKYAIDIDRRLIWSQAIAAAESGDITQYSLSAAELDDLDQVNRSFVVIDNAEQFIRKYFEPASETNALSVLLSSAEIQSYIEHRTGLRAHERAYREALRRLGWKHDDAVRFRVTLINVVDVAGAAGTMPGLPELPETPTEKQSNIPF